MEDLYRSAVLEGLEEAKRSLPGDDPMKKAWRVALSRMIDDMALENPDREGAIRLAPLEMDPGDTPYLYGFDRVRSAASVFIGALLGWFVVSPALTSLGMTGDFPLFMGTALGATGLSFFRRKTESVDLKEIERRLETMLSVARERIERAVEDGEEDSRRVSDDLWIGRALADLRAVPMDQLETAVEALLIEGENRGYGGPSTYRPGADSPAPSTTVWSSELSETYESFGHYEDGTPVTVERAPVFRDGSLVVKGLVRRRSSR